MEKDLAKKLVEDKGLVEGDSVLTTYKNGEGVQQEVVVGVYDGCRGNEILLRGAFDILTPLISNQGRFPRISSYQGILKVPVPKNSRREYFVGHKEIIEKLRQLGNGYEFYIPLFQQEAE